MELLNYHKLAEIKMTDRFSQDPVFVAIIKTLVDLKVLRQQQCINLTDTFLDIDKSIGVNLDVIGKLIGQPRELVNFINEPYFGFQGAYLAQEFDVGYWYSLYQNKLGTLKVLSDEQYRRVLKARVIKNSSKNTRDDLLNVINLLTNNNLSRVNEPYHGVVELYLSDETGIASYFTSKYKNDQNLIPLPLGFRLDISYQQTEPPIPDPLSPPYNFNLDYVEDLESTSLYWESDEIGVTFNIYRSESPIDVNNLPTPLVTGLIVKSYLDNSVESEKTYYYRVGVNKVGLQQAIGNELSITIPLPLTAPFNLQGEWNEITESIDLTWEHFS